MSALWPRLGEAQNWILGTIVAAAAHGLGVAALIDVKGQARHASAAIPIEVRLGAESEMQREQADVAPGERQQEAAPPRRNVIAPTPEAPLAAEGELALAEPMERELETPPNFQTPAPETTAPQLTQSQSTRAHPRTASYAQILLAHLERHKRYPRAARSRRQQGVVHAWFRMDRQGQVLEARISRSSGHDLLDREVLAMLQRAQPLPPPPHSLAGAAIELTAPIEFELR